MTSSRPKRPRTFLINDLNGAQSVFLADRAHLELRCLCDLLGAGARLIAAFFVASIAIWHCRAHPAQPRAARFQSPPPHSVTHATRCEATFSPGKISRRFSVEPQPQRRDTEARTITVYHALFGISPPPPPLHQGLRDHERAAPCKRDRASCKPAKSPILAIDVLRLESACHYSRSAAREPTVQHSFLIDVILHVPQHRHLYPMLALPLQIRKAGRCPRSITQCIA